MRIALIALSALLLFACNDPSSEGPAPAPSLQDRGYGTATVTLTEIPSSNNLSATITPTTWTDFDGQTYTISQFVFSSNGYAVAVIAQNDASDTSNPTSYSRFDVVTAETAVYVCHTTDTAADAASALATPAADSTNLAAGCNLGAWTLYSD